MGYIEENLMPGETIITKARLHWGMFVPPGIFVGLGGLLTLLVSLPLLASFGAVAPGQDEAMAGVASFASFSIMCCVLPYLLVSAVMMGSALSRYLTTEFALTDRRIIAKWGLLRRGSLELMLQKVESIGVSQPLFGRIFNYGTIVVSGSGGTRQPFPNIADPMRLRGQVNALISRTA